jgi:5-methylcytosine-specific restriction endonuclease McrA
MLEHLRACAELPIEAADGMNDSNCSVPGCPRPRLARELCANHYDLDRQSRQGPCSVDTCDLPARSRSWCATHYGRWKKDGDVHADVPIRKYLPDGQAWCPACRSVKPIGAFIPNKGRPNGINSYCRACAVGLRRTKYRDRLYLQQKRWREANPEVTARYNRNWADRNPDKVRAKAARQLAAHPERYRQYARASESNRRACARSAPGHATAGQIMARWEYFGNRCWMCGAAADVTDHVKPLTKGGSSWPANLRPACTPCNNRKRAKWPFPLEVAGGSRPADGQAA